MTDSNLMTVDEWIKNLEEVENKNILKDELNPVIENLAQFYDNFNYRNMSEELICSKSHLK